jgi:hypothetical protein
MCDGVPNVKKNELKAWIGKILNAFVFQYFKIIFVRPLQKNFKVVSSPSDIAKKKGKQRKKINILHDKLYL